MKIQELLENNVVDAAERFRNRIRDSKKDTRSTGYEDAVLADISKITQPRWSKKFYHPSLDENNYHREDDYLTRLYFSLPFPDEEMTPERRIAYTIFINNKDYILNMLSQQTKELEQLKAKYKGLFIFTKLIDDYIVMTDMLYNNFADYTLEKGG